MATLFLTVFDGADIKLIDRPLQHIPVAITAASVQSAAITGKTGKIRNVNFHADADCFVLYGEDPTVLNDGTAGMPLGAENPVVLGVRAGDLVAVIERV